MTRTERNNRPGRESLSKRLGAVVSRGIRSRDNCRCVYCGRTERQSGDKLQLDHLMPQSHGGEDVANNLVLACRRCNRARSNMTLSQWSAYAAVKLGLVFSPIKVRAQARRRLS